MTTPHTGISQDTVARGPHGPGTSGASARERLLAALPVIERRLSLAGVGTAVLEGGGGPPLVLLHGPGAYGAAWGSVIPALVSTYRVIAPDLPAHGASDVLDDPPDVERVNRWLDDLIERTCTSPPMLVGQLLGGGQRLSRFPKPILDHRRPPRRPGAGGAGRS